MPKGTKFKTTTGPLYCKDIRTIFIQFYATFRGFVLSTLNEVKMKSKKKKNLPSELVAQLLEFMNALYKNATNGRLLF